MRKEILFAIISGIVFGLIIAFGIWRTNIALKNKKTPPPTSSSITPTPQQNSNIELVIVKPQENDIIYENPLILSGLTKSNALVVISTEERDLIISPDASGAFEKELDLDPAINSLVITSVDDSGATFSKNLTLIFSSEFAKLVDLEGQKEATSEAKENSATDSVRKRVEEKLQKATNKPKAFLGTVTDIAEGVIQLKNKNAEIQQVSIKEDVSFIKIDKSTTEVKYKDLAIGDYIVAMGFANGNGVLEGKRILIVNPVKALQVNVILGTITDLSKSSVTITNKKGSEEGNFTFSKNIKVENEVGGIIKTDRLSDLGVGQQIVAVLKVDDSATEVRTIRIISSSPSPTPEQ
jgi:hypothetical protein